MSVARTLQYASPAGLALQNAVPGATPEVRPAISP